MTPNNLEPVDVCIVTYNAEPFILKCIESVERQNWPVSIHVRDNASTDGTPALLEEAGGLEYLELSSENVGFAQGCNSLARRGQARHILFLNPDCILRDPDQLARILAGFRAGGPRRGILSPRLVRADGSLDHACKRSLPTILNAAAYYARVEDKLPRLRWLSGYQLGWIDPADEADVGAVNGAFMLIERELFTLCGGFDERYFMYAEDIDLCRSVRGLGRLVQYLGPESVTHLKGASNSGRRPVRARIAFAQSMIQYALKHARSWWRNDT